jgi:hypothetical protein
LLPFVGHLKMLLGYIDARPFLYLGGVPLALVVAWIIARTARRRFATPGFLVSTLAIYTSLFVFIFAGPFVGRESTETFDMTWKIAETPSDGQREAEVILTFVKHPSYGVGEYSDELAGYLQENNETVVPVSFRVTRDFGHVRGFHVTKVGNLTKWKSTYGYYSSCGDGSESPWQNRTN